MNILSDLLDALYEEFGISKPTNLPYTVEDIEKLAVASNIPLGSVLKLLHDKANARVSPTPTFTDLYRFNANVPVPAGLAQSELKAALDATQEYMAMLNYEIFSFAGIPLTQLIQANNFSGIVSNLLAVAMEKHTPFKRNHDQRHPDLISTATGETIGLELKAAVKAGKGGEGHNGLGGWHMVACYSRSDDGLIRFSHIEIAELISHYAEPNGDWKYQGSNVSDEGTQRTETYSTTLRGTWKLRHGTVYLDPLLWPNWKRLKSGAKKAGPIPTFSPWAEPQSQTSLNL